MAEQLLSTAVLIGPTSRTSSSPGKQRCMVEGGLSSQTLLLMGLVFLLPLCHSPFILAFLFHVADCVLNAIVGAGDSVQDTAGCLNPVVYFQECYVH